MRTDQRERTLFVQWAGEVTAVAAVVIMPVLLFPLTFVFAPIVVVLFALHEMEQELNGHGAERRLH